MPNYSNTAVETTLNGSITSGDTTATLTVATGYPAAPFTLVIDPGLAAEEVIRVGTRSGTALSAMTRAWGGTTASAHTNGAVVRHVADASAIASAVNRVFDVTDFGAVPDALFTDGVSTASSTTFTSATAAFVAGDVGKTIVLEKCSSSSAGRPHHTTVASVTNGTTVVLTDASGRTATQVKFRISRSGDQTAAIQAAIDACATWGGGAVVLPGNGYLTTGLVLKNHVYLEGLAVKSTLLHLLGSTSAPVVRNDWTSNDNAQFVGVRHLTIDGNINRCSDLARNLHGTTGAYTAGNSTITLSAGGGTGLPPSGALLIGTNRLTYTSVSGDVLSGVSGGRQNTTDANASAGAAVTVYYGYGILFVANPGNTVHTFSDSFDPHNLVEDVFVRTCRADGIALWGQSGTSIINCMSYANNQLNFRASWDTVLSGCQSVGAGYQGFYVPGSSCMLTACKAFTSGGNDNAQGHGFLVEGILTIEEGEKTLVGCNAQDNYASGFRLRLAQRVHLTGCLSSSNSQRGAGSNCAVEIESCSNCLLDFTSVETGHNAGGDRQSNALEVLSTLVQSTNNKIRLTHGASSGSTVGTALKSGSDVSQCDVSINGMGGYAAVTFATPYVPDPYLATIIKLGALTSNLTVSAPTNLHAGCRLILWLTQDGTGGRTVTWNAAFSTTIYTNTGNTANKKCYIEFIYDAANWIEVDCKTWF